MFQGFLNLLSTNIFPLRWQGDAALHESSIKPNPLQITIIFHALAMYSQDHNQENRLKNAARCDEHTSIFNNNIPSPVFLKNLFQKVKD